MNRHAGRARRGITLTEILISIMIIGVGMISLATLFPLGLIRLRNAQRLTRGGFLVESAGADLGARNLLSQASFLANPLIAQCYQSATTGTAYNPWLQDPASPWGDPNANPFGVSRPQGPGLPVAYDPLWRASCQWSGGTGLYPVPLTAASLSPPEARFGQGVGFGGGGWVRTDPDGSPASAYGLPRLTNLPPAMAIVAQEVFVSPEDMVMQDPKGQYYDPDNTSASPTQMPSPSSVVPDLTMGTNNRPETVNDWRFTWFFTGQQSDSSNGTVFDGDIVVCENRQFGVEVVPGPLGGNVFQSTGESVVEAVFGYTTAGTGTGYGGASAQRSVLLRWPVGMPDPDVRVGSWIADVTYERTATVVGSDRWSNIGSTNPPTPSPFPAQRCYWYQVAKRTEPADSVPFQGDPTSYRSMTVWTTTPLRALTPLVFGTATRPYHVESALIMPSVVNVFPRTIYTR